MLSKDNLMPSSSLILIRDSNDGVEVFLMKRAQKSNFGGVWVFPGGILEKLDRLMATEDYCSGISETEAKEVLNNNSDSLPYWIASLRETFEETGALIANRNDNSDFIPTAKVAEALVDLRSDLLNGKIAFGSILKELGLKHNNLSESDIEQIFNIFIKKITSALKENKNVELRGFGTLKKKVNKAKQVRNPKTSEKLFKKENFKLHFKIGKILHSKLNSN